MLTSGVVLKLLKNKELWKANCKKEIINIKHEDILTGTTDMHLSL